MPAATSDAAPSPLRSTTETVAPSSAIRRAVARPMPDAPPVITARCPSNRPMGVPFLARPPQGRATLGRVGQQLPERRPVELAQHTERQVVGEHHELGRLVGGQPGHGSRSTRSSADTGSEATTTAPTRSPSSGSGTPTTPTSVTRGMGAEHLFDLDGSELLAAPVDGVRDPTGQVQVALVVLVADVPGVQPLRGGVLLGLHQELAHVPGGHGPSGGRVDDGHLHPGQGPAHRPEPVTAPVVVGVSAAYAPSVSVWPKVLEKSTPGRAATARRTRSTGAAAAP